MFLFLGVVLAVLGMLAALNSLSLVKKAVRVWPRPIERRSAEAMASYEFLVRFLGLVTALAGIGVILSVLF